MSDGHNRFEDEMSTSMDLPEENSLSVNLKYDDEHNFPHQQGEVLHTDLPARIDRLPWSFWHWKTSMILGIAWILDGMEVTTVSLAGNRLTTTEWKITDTEASTIGSVYIAGTMTGALIFGGLADKLGRKRLFPITPAVYMLASIGATFAWNYWAFLVFNFFIGLGIGGEYSAMNSAINELIPSRVRGLVDVAINGSYWLGAAITSAYSLYFLRAESENGWRIPFGIGAGFAFLITLSRLTLDESPRWLLMHGRPQEAEEIVQKMEREVAKSLKEGEMLPVVEQTIAINIGGKKMNIAEVARYLFSNYLKRAILGSVLMISQAFFYNAIFFTFPSILTRYYEVEQSDTPIFVIPFAMGNFLGAITIGRFFDTIGRKIMICFTYTMSGFLLIITGVLFACDLLNEYTQTLCWSIVFFFSSAGASSAYLTISEIFPMEVRALAIAVFFSIGTLGGMVGPALLGFLSSSNDRWEVVGGYALAGVLMFLASIVEWIWGVDAEGLSLEEIAAPISAATAQEEISNQQSSHQQHLTTNGSSSIN